MLFCFLSRAVLVNADPVFKQLTHRYVALQSTRAVVRVISETRAFLLHKKRYSRDELHTRFIKNVRVRVRWSERDSEEWCRCYAREKTESMGTPPVRNFRCIRKRRKSVETVPGVLRFKIVQNRLRGGKNQKQKYLQKRIRTV